MDAFLRSFVLPGRIEVVEQPAWAFDTVDALNVESAGGELAFEFSREVEVGVRER
jgi:hypothetical protein